jgi:valyl-tRNA synthetase
MMKLVHPFMPFISEEIWQLFDERKSSHSISIKSFPEFDKTMINDEAEKEIEFVQDVVTAIRNIRGEMNIPPSKAINLYLKTDKLTADQQRYIKSLVRVEELFVDTEIEKPKASASAVVKGCDVFIPLEGLIDVELEKNRIEKEIGRLEGLLNGVTKKLSNANFVDKAPADVVEKEKIKKHDWEISIGKLKSILEDLT